MNKIPIHKYNILLLLISLFSIVMPMLWLEDYRAAHEIKLNILISQIITLILFKSPTNSHTQLLIL